MNPAQYKEAMRQRALDRQASLQLLETQHRDNPLQLPTLAPRDGLAATAPPRRGSAIARGGKDLLSRFDSDGDMSSAAKKLQASSADKSALGLDVLHHHQQSAGRLYANDDELSPLAPGSLNGFRKGAARASGFDKQAGIQSPGTNSVSPRDDLWEDDGEDDKEEEEELSFAAQRRERRIHGWERLPGETSITTAVRMYFANLDPEASHQENCGVVLHQILERVAIEELDVPALKMRHVIKVEAFLRAIVLSVPARSWKQSFRGAFTLAASAGSMKSAGHGQHLSLDELTFRMSLFVRMLRAERAGGGNADEAVDPMRVESVLRGYAANAAEILPLQRPARSLLPRLLYCMACEMLNVRLLAPEVRDMCRQIVSDYEARAKLWMSPAQNAERYLLPLVAEFASWIRRNKDVLYQGSATEGLLRSIDERLRFSLKNQVYRSPQHFLAVLRSMEVELTDMPLPSYDPSGGDDDHPFDVCQTVKDVNREKFDVNRVPTNPSDCWCKIRTSLFQAALEHHSDSVEPSEIGADEGGGGLLTCTESLTRATTRKDGLCGLDPSTLCDTAVEESSTASGDAAAGKRVSPGGSGVDGEGKAGKVKVWGVGNECKGDMKGNRRASMSGLETYLDQCAWRVLHAASRTASGGDGFFVVQDLFGGDGVFVKMATAATESIKIRTKEMAARVTTVDKYDIYHTSDVDINSALSEASPRPLMTITTTMKEVIQFSPYADTSIGRKSAIFSAEHASQTHDEASNRHPSHALSGRYITISADLPDYPEHHLDASAGVLVAPPLASPPTEDPQLHQDRVAVSGVTGATALLAVNGEGTLPRSDSTESGRSSPPRPPVYGPVNCGLRASAFNSPPPTRPPKGRNVGADSEIEADDGSGRGSCSFGDEEEGEGEKGTVYPWKNSRGCSSGGRARFVDVGMLS